MGDTVLSRLMWFTGCVVWGSACVLGLVYLAAGAITVIKRAWQHHIEHVLVIEAERELRRVVR